MIYFRPLRTGVSASYTSGSMFDMCQPYSQFLSAPYFCLPSSWRVQFALVSGWGQRRRICAIRAGRNHGRKGFRYLRAVMTARPPAFRSRLLRVNPIRCTATPGQASRTVCVRFRVLQCSVLINSCGFGADGVNKLHLISKRFTLHINVPSYGTIAYWFLRPSSQAAVFSA